MTITSIGEFSTIGLMYLIESSGFQVSRIAFGVDGPAQIAAVQKTIKLAFQHARGRHVERGVGSVGSLHPRGPVILAIRLGRSASRP